MSPRTWILVLLMVVLLLAFLWSIRAKPLPGLPTPEFHFWVGNLPTVMKNRHRFYDWHTDLTHKFNRSYQIVTPGRANIKVVDAAGIEHVTKTNIANYEKGVLAIDRLAWKELGVDGIFLAQGKEWHRIRKAISPFFNDKFLGDIMTPCFIKFGELVVKRLLEAPSNTAVDIQDLFFRYTMDSFCEIGFGKGTNSLSNPKPDEFSLAFDRMTHRTLMRRVELLGLFKIKKWLGAKDEVQMTKDCATLDSYLYPIVDQAIKDAEAGIQPDHINSLSLLTGTMGIRNRKELRDNAVGFLLAGRDTTASLLTSIFSLLSKNPEVEDKVVDEIDRVLVGQMPTKDSVSHLEYLKLVFQEALRLYPSAPMEYRTALQNDTLPDGTFVPAGTEVHYTPWVMGRNPVHFPDWQTFRPERWQGEEGAALPKQDSFELPLFNSGPRNCLGKNMSLLEARVLVAMILQQCRLRLVPGEHEEFVVSLTLERHGGVHATVLPRKDI